MAALPRIAHGPRRVERRSTAFTLIELLVVISIIVLLISMLLPALKRARDAAKTTACKSQLRSIGIASHTYLNDNKYHFPIFTPKNFAHPKQDEFGHSWARKLYEGYMSRGATQCPSSVEEKRLAWYVSQGYFDTWGGACSYTAHFRIFLDWRYISGTNVSPGDPSVRPYENALMSIKRPSQIAILWDDGWVSSANGIAPPNASPGNYVRNGFGGVLVWWFRHSNDGVLNTLFADGHAVEATYQLPNEWDVVNQ